MPHRCEDVLTRVVETRLNTVTRDLSKLLGDALDILQDQSLNDVPALDTLLQKFRNSIHDTLFSALTSIQMVSSEQQDYPAASFPDSARDLFFSAHQLQPPSYPSRPLHPLSAGTPGLFPSQPVTYSSTINNEYPFITQYSPFLASLPTYYQLPTYPLTMPSAMFSNTAHLAFPPGLPHVIAASDVGDATLPDQPPGGRTHPHSEETERLAATPRNSEALGSVGEAHANAPTSCANRERVSTRDSSHSVQGAPFHEFEPTVLDLPGLDNSYVAYSSGANLLADDCCDEKVYAAFPGSEPLDGEVDDDDGADAHDSPVASRKSLALPSATRQGDGASQLRSCLSSTSVTSHKEAFHYFELCNDNYNEKTGSRSSSLAPSPVLAKTWRRSNRNAETLLNASPVSIRSTSGHLCSSKQLLAGSSLTYDDAASAAPAAPQPRRLVRSQLGDAPLREHSQEAAPRPGDLATADYLFRMQQKLDEASDRRRLYQAQRAKRARDVVDAATEKGQKARRLMEARDSALSGLTHTRMVRASAIRQQYLALKQSAARSVLYRVEAIGGSSASVAHETKEAMRANLEARYEEIRQRREAFQKTRAQNAALVFRSAMARRVQRESAISGGAASGAREAESSSASPASSALPVPSEQPAQLAQPTPPSKRTKEVSTVWPFCRLSETAGAQESLPLSHGLVSHNLQEYDIFTTDFFNLLSTVLVPGLHEIRKSTTQLFSGITLSVSADDSPALFVSQPAAAVQHTGPSSACTVDVADFASHLLASCTLRLNVLTPMADFNFFSSADLDHATEMIQSVFSFNEGRLPYTDCSGVAYNTRGLTLAVIAYIKGNMLCNTTEPPEELRLYVGLLVFLLLDTLDNLSIFCFSDAIEVLQILSDQHSCLLERATDNPLSDTARNLCVVSQLYASLALLYMKLPFLFSTHLDPCTSVRDDSLAPGADGETQISYDRFVVSKNVECTSFSKFIYKTPGVLFESLVLCLLSTSLNVYLRLASCTKGDSSKHLRMVEPFVNHLLADGFLLNGFCNRLIAPLVPSEKFLKSIRDPPPVKDDAPSTSSDLKAEMERLFIYDNFSSVQQTLKFLQLLFSAHGKGHLDNSLLHIDRHIPLMFKSIVTALAQILLSSESYINPYNNSLVPQVTAIQHRKTGQRVYDVFQFFSATASLQLNTADENAPQIKPAYSLKKDACVSSCAAHNVVDRLHSQSGESVLAADMHSLVSDMFLILALIARFYPGLLALSIDTDEICFLELYHVVSMVITPGILFPEETSLFTNFSIPFVSFPPRYPVNCHSSVEESSASRFYGYYHKTTETCMTLSINKIAAIASTKFIMDTWPFKPTIRSTLYHCVTMALFSALLFLKIALYSGKNKLPGDCSSQMHKSLMRVCTYGDDPVVIKAIAITLPIECYTDTQMRYELISPIIRSLDGSDVSAQVREGVLAETPSDLIRRRENGPAGPSGQSIGPDLAGLFIGIC